MRKIRIGITMSVDPQESLFSNGIRQNIIILRELFEKCSNVERAYIINTSGKQLPSDPSLPLYPFLPYIIDLNEVKGKCDLVITAHGSLFVEEYRDFVKNGIKIVKHMLGPSLSMFNETVLFKDNDKAQNLFDRNSGTVSAIWFSKHFFGDRYFFETVYEAPTMIAPYVWDPRFIENSIKQYEQKNNRSPLYQPSGKTEKRLSCFEPNLNIVKNSTMAVIITERFYRQYPQLLDNSYIFNADRIKTKTDFIHFVKNLNCNRDGKISFEGGMSIVNALAKYTDIVIAHQNGCELNYLYLDAAWMGYPILHNSQMMREVGFYYEKNDAEMASQTLHSIARDFDGSFDSYRKKSRRASEEYLITNETNIREYERLIGEVV